MAIQTNAGCSAVRRPMKPGKIILKLFYLGLMAALCFLFLFPIVWMVVNSLKPESEIYAQMSSIKTFFLFGLNDTIFDSYINLFTTFDNFTRSVANSFFYSGSTILGVLLINSFAGYALARLVFPGSKMIVNMILLLIIVPVETSIVPMYVILFKMGLLEENLRVLGYLLPSFASPFYIFMFRSYFLGMPKELEEAASIDGCNRFKTYFKIIMPLSKGIFATVAIFTFMGAWNDYVFAQLMFSKPEMQPLQVFLQLVNTFNPKDLSVVLASLTVSTIPIAIVYIFCQKYIVEGVSFSGLK